MLRLKDDDAKRLVDEFIIPAIAGVVEKTIDKLVREIREDLGWKVQRYAWSNSLRRPDISVAEKLEAIERYLGLEFTRTRAVPSTVEVKPVPPIPKKEV